MTLLAHALSTNPWDQRAWCTTQKAHLYLCSVRELPSSFCLLVEFQEGVRLAKEILEINMEIMSSHILVQVDLHPGNCFNPFPFTVI